MEITYHSQGCVRLRGRDVQVVIDPPKGTGAGVASKGAHYVLALTEGSTTDPAKLRTHSAGPQTVSGPGEYELGGVSFQGLATDRNTIMRIEIEGVRVVALGLLDRQLTESEVEALGAIDVLLIPAGGGDALSATEAVKLVRDVEPAVVVPVRYGTGEDAKYEPVDKFVAEMGLSEGWSAQPKLNLTGAAGAGQETRVVILEARN